MMFARASLELPLPARGKGLFCLTNDTLMKILCVPHGKIEIIFVRTCA